MSELPGMNTSALKLFLEGNGIVLRGDLRVEMISGGRSNLTFKAFDDVSAWVVRRPPTSGLTPSAHDMTREWAVTSALEATEVPVARTVAFEDGRVVRSSTDLEDFTDAQIEANTAELIRVLARLHDVDYKSVGLDGFGKPTGFVQRQVATWSRQWESVKTRELDDVARLRDALHSTVPSASETSIVHGDYRVDNVILDKVDVGSITAVVDWEMSTLGDPLTDIALMCVYRQPVFDVVLGMSAAWTSPRYPSADELAQRYTRASGRELAHWDFYTALANFKLAVISEGITHRARLGVTAGSGAELAAEATQEFIAAGLRAIRRSKH